MRERIENITEQDFWSSFRRTPQLIPAIDVGLAGRRDEAYALLGRYHAKSLAVERDLYVAECKRVLDSAAVAAKDRDQAEQVLRHDICGWHTHRKQFGRTIDFNADFGQSGQYGFHYLGWLHPVLQQYVRTGDTRYRNGFIEIVKQYYDQRTTLTWRIPRLHPVYYELGARAKTQLLLPAYALLTADDCLLDTDTREALLKLLLGFARSLFRLQASGYRAGNWQIVGSETLFALGTAFPEFRSSGRWRRRASVRVEEHRARDFFSDGCHGERCWGYGWMSLSGMIGYYRTAVRSGVLTGPGKGSWTRFLKRALRWYAASIAPGGMTLNYGDGSIGRINAVFDTATDLFPELAHGPGLLGVDRSQSCLLRPSGYAFMRDGDGARDDDTPFMSINFGGWGGWHTHEDLLDFTMWCFGEPIIEEVGRFGSYDNPLEPMFRAPQAHNQIVLEHLPMNRHNSRGHDVQWHTAVQCDYFSACHDAFERARVHRHILFVKAPAGKPRTACYWIVHDVIAAREYIFQASNYLHAPRPFRELGPGRFRVDGKPSCLAVVARPDDVRRTELAPDYTSAERDGATNDWDRERHRLVLTKWHDVGTQTPVTFTVLLVPFRGARPPRASIEERASKTDDAGAGKGVFTVTLGDRQDLVVFNPDAQRVNVNGKQITGPVAVRRGTQWTEIGR